MDLVDSFQLQIFQVTTLNTVDVPGILQFPAGTSLNLAFYIFDWSQISTVPASDDGYQPFMQCGQSLPSPVYSVGNSVQVIFTSLSSQYPGFNATYTAITYSSGTWYTLFIRHQRLS